MNEDLHLGGITVVLLLPSGVILLALWLTERRKQRDKGREACKEGFFFLLNESGKMAEAGKTDSVLLTDSFYRYCEA